MFDTKVAPEETGQVRLMSLDGPELSLPFGPPLATYLHSLGPGGPVEPARRPPVLSWVEVVRPLLTPIDRDLNEEETVPEPPPAGWLALPPISGSEPEPALLTDSCPAGFSAGTVTLGPREALPLRPRIRIAAPPPPAAPAMEKGRERREPPPPAAPIPLTLRATPSRQPGSPEAAERPAAGLTARVLEIPINRPPAVARQSPASVSSAPPLPKPEPAEIAVPAPTVPVEPEASEDIVPAPVRVESHLSTLEAASEPGGLFESIPMLFRIAVPLLAVAGGIAYYLLSPAPSSRPAPALATIDQGAVGSQGWVNEWASDSGGSRRGRQLTVYRPSANLSDYQFQFSGQIESKALAWVFRASDTKNYYLMKLVINQSGNTTSVSLQRMAVVDGRESAFSERPLPLVARPDTVFRVKLDVKGPRFTVSVQDQPVDLWTDNRLQAGAVGFSTERDERARTYGVSFSHYSMAPK